MGDSQKSYYQVSFTGTQALVGLLVVLGALGLSFFLGARAGMSGSREAERNPVAIVPPQESTAASSLASPASAQATSSPAATPGTATPATGSAGSAPGPIVTQTFEDREAGLPEETAPRSTELKPAESRPSRTEIAGPPSAPAKPGGFYVQVLSTSSKAEASRWKDRLAGKKYKASVSSVESKKGKLFRVRVGPYSDKEQAKKVAAKISSEDKRQAWVAPAE